MCAFFSWMGDTRLLRLTADALMAAVDAAVLSWLTYCPCVELTNHHQLFPRVSYALCYSLSQNIIMYDVFSNSSNMCCRKCNWPSNTNVTGCLIFQYVLPSFKTDAGECPTLCNPVVLLMHTIFQSIAVKYLFWLLWLLRTNWIS